MTHAELYLLLAKVAAGDPAAADELDALAEKLKAVAAVLRAPKAEDPYEVVGGMADRVLVNVVGPDGRVRVKTDTGS